MNLIQLIQFQTIIYHLQIENVIKSLYSISKFD